MRERTFKDDFKGKIEKVLWNLHNSRYYWRREGTTNKPIMYEEEAEEYRNWFNEVLDKLLKIKVQRET